MVNVMYINGPFQSFKTTVVVGALEAMQAQGFNVMMLMTTTSEVVWLKACRKVKIPVVSISWILNNPVNPEVTCIGVDCSANKSWTNEVLEKLKDGMSHHPMATILWIAN